MLAPRLCFKARTSGIATSSRRSYEPARAVAQRRQTLCSASPPHPPVGGSASPIRRKSEVQPLAASSLPELFESYNGITVLDFHRENCGPCKVLGAELMKVESRYNADQLSILKVNTDEQSQLASAYRVQGLPTLVFLRNGQEVYRINGLSPKTLQRLPKVFNYYVKGLDQTYGAM